MHGCVLRAGVAALVATLRAKFATAVFRLVVDQPDLICIGANAVRNFLAQPLLERFLVKVVVGRLLVVAGWDLAFLCVAGDLRLASGSPATAPSKLARSIRPRRWRRATPS